jgi:hypothetical protein
MSDVFGFKLDNTHYSNSLSDDVYVCMFHLSHCLLIAKCSLQYVITTQVGSIVHNLVNENLVAMNVQVSSKASLTFGDHTRDNNRSS